VHPDLETIVAADEEARRRVDEARERITARIRDARAASDRSREALVAAVRAACDGSIRNMREAARLRTDERRRDREAESRRRLERSDQALERAVERYLAILSAEGEDR
jgi:vacuolar-type H+-ATPase subunit H